MRFSPFLLLVTFALIACCSTSAFAKDLIQVKSSRTNSQRQLTDESGRNLRGSVREEREAGVLSGLAEKFRGSLTTSKEMMRDFSASAKTKMAKITGKNRMPTVKLGSTPLTTKIKVQLAAIKAKALKLNDILKAMMSKFRGKNPQAAAKGAWSSPIKKIKAQLAALKTRTIDLYKSAMTKMSKTSGKNQQAAKNEVSSPQTATVKSSTGAETSVTVANRRTGAGIETPIANRQRLLSLQRANDANTPLRRPLPDK